MSTEVNAGEQSPVETLPVVGEKPHQHQTTEDALRSGAMVGKTADQILDADRKYVNKFDDIAKLQATQEEGIVKQVRGWYQDIIDNNPPAEQTRIVQFVMDTYLKRKKLLKDSDPRGASRANSAYQLLSSCKTIFAAEKYAAYQIDFDKGINATRSEAKAKLDAIELGTDGQKKPAKVDAFAKAVKDAGKLAYDKAKAEGKSDEEADAAEVAERAARRANRDETEIANAVATDVNRLMKSKDGKPGKTVGWVQAYCKALSKAAETWKDTKAVEADIPAPTKGKRRRVAANKASKGATATV